MVGEIGGVPPHTWGAVRLGPAAAEAGASVAGEVGVGVGVEVEVSAVGQEEGGEEVG